MSATASECRLEQMTTMAIRIRTPTAHNNLILALGEDHGLVPAAAPGAGAKLAIARFGIPCPQDLALQSASIHGESRKGDVQTPHQDPSIELEKVRNLLHVTNAVTSSHSFCICKLLLFRN